MTASGFLNPGKARSPQKGVGHQSLVYANAPITPQVEWPAPEPLRQVVEACMQELPEARPTVGELREMVEAIDRRRISAPPARSAARP